MQTYSKTKDSGVEWLGRIPQEWSLSKISANFRRKKIRGMVNEELLSVYRDYGVVIKSSRDDNHNAASEDLSNYQLVEAGDLVTNKMKTWQGSIAISEYRGIVSPAYFILSPTSTKMVPKYIHYLLRSPIYIAQYNRFSKGIRIGQWDLEYEQFKTFPLLLPPHEIQQKIADSLDTETAQIDNLIAKQERLLELLEEKRRATITHAVTRGLNPSVELKETNIPWIGRIPTDWKLAKIKTIAEINNGADYKDIELSDGGYPVIGSGGEFARASRYAYDGKSVLFGRKGTVDKPLFFEGKFWTVDTMFWSKIDEKHAVPKFVYYAALAIPYDYYQTKTALPSMTQSNLLNHHIALPGMDTQQKISDSLDSYSRKTDELKQKIQTQIALLRERRTSLISHAVTGKVMI